MANVLGVHDMDGRGCAGCHAPHTDSALSQDAGAGLSGETVGEVGKVALWSGSSATPYGATVVFGDLENYVEVTAARVTSSSQDVTGVLLCLSCHDGNITPQSMLPMQSYVRRMGFLGASPGRQPIPTLLGDAGLPSLYAFEHPLGTDATIELSDGLGFSNGMFSVVPGSPYARFMENYGLPVLTPGKRSVPYGVDGTGRPYVLCTTCHNQHAMSVFPSGINSPVGGDVTGRAYKTYFFANGPYDPKFDEAPSERAPSTAQFCRQCHLDLANEGNNTLNIKTALY